MPTEDGIFKKYDVIFKEDMARLNDNRNAIKGLLQEGFLEKLGLLQYNFEGIQKRLKMFLENKRGFFARFYFLPDNDLLEMIGSSKEPKKIMIHIGKIFEGIKDLGYNNDNKGPRGKSVEIESIKSSDGEEITIQAVEVDSKIEIWIKKLLKAMQVQIGKLFQKWLGDGT